MKKKYLIILAIVFVLFFILYKLNQDEFVVEERDGIKIVNYSVIFPAHVGGYNSLFYGFDFRV